MLLLAAAAPSARPRRRVRSGQYGAALEREDWTAAYRLMSAGYRKRVSPRPFRKLMQAAPRTTEAAGRALRENAAAWAARAEMRWARASG